jgi:hypothetical protein
MPANDHLGPGPGPIMLSPAGYIVRLPESTSGAPVVTPVLSGSGLITAGTGDHPVTMAGTSGTVDIQLTAGAPGAARAVAYLVDNAATPTARLGISLDASNRPYAVLQDINGVVVAQSDTMGPTLPAGTPLHVTLTWDSRHAFNGSDFVLISINGGVANLWFTEAKAPWTPFVPASLLVGYGNVGTFNGTLGLVQVTNAGNEFVSSTVTPPHPDVVLMQASSSIAAPLKLNQVLASHPVTAAHVAAALKAAYTVTAAPVSTASVVAAMTQHIFTPADLGAAIYGWFRGDTAPTLDGSNLVVSLADKGPNGYTATQPTPAMRLGYNANGGLGYLFNTVPSGNVSLVAAGSPGHAGPIEVFAVVRPDSATPGTAGIVLDSSPGLACMLAQQTPGGEYIGWSGAMLMAAQITVADHILNAQFDGVTSSISIDNGAAVLGDLGTAALGASLTIGKFASTGHESFVGRIYEIIVIIGLLSAQNRAAMNYYLKHRYTIA